MKGLFVVSVVLSLSLATNRTSDDVVLTAWPKGQLFYIGEPMVLTCEVKRNSSEEWIYSWFRNLSKASSPGHAHRVNNQTYSISALTHEDNGTYQCGAQNKNMSMLQNNTVSIKVTTDPPPASLEVSPNSSQHFKGEQFSLNCSVHDNTSTLWVLKRLRVAEENVKSWKPEGKPEQPYEWSFNVTSGLSGLYWCEAAGGNQRSNAISIIVSGELHITNTSLFNNKITQRKKRTI
ncbi:uncharacterized protein LOC131362027 isoform X2 [Hemibagrus wyckioides]|uniref:uncharacterized protein LOC131362027 isoform X2 n=1 Tax=Hemibagrus wyckioides TaxID=337641 RepID=UPI00266DB6C4|nr:uncharacterized protein LOC131362027 isoform X2 [Hemibagrus wyckioides]